MDKGGDKKIDNDLPMKAILVPKADIYMFS